MNYKHHDIGFLTKDYIIKKMTSILQNVYHPYLQIDKINHRDDMDCDVLDLQDDLQDDLQEQIDKRNGLLYVTRQGNDKYALSIIKAGRTKDKKRINTYENQANCQKSKIVPVDDCYKSETLILGLMYPFRIKNKNGRYTEKVKIHWEISVHLLNYITTFFKSIDMTFLNQFKINGSHSIPQVENKIWQTIPDSLFGQINRYLAKQMFSRYNSYNYHISEFISFIDKQLKPRDCYIILIKYFTILIIKYHIDNYHSHISYESYNLYWTKNVKDNCIESHNLQENKMINHIKNDIFNVTALTQDKFKNIMYISDAILFNS